MAHLLCFEFEFIRPDNVIQVSLRSSSERLLLSFPAAQFNGMRERLKPLDSPCHQYVPPYEIPGPRPKQSPKIRHLKSN